MPNAKSEPARRPAKGSMARAACSPDSMGILFTKRVAAVATIIKKEKNRLRKPPNTSQAEKTSTYPFQFFYLTQSC